VIILDGSLLRVASVGLIHTLLRQLESLRALMEKDTQLAAYVTEQHLREATVVHCGSAEKWRDYLQLLTGPMEHICLVLDDCAGNPRGGSVDMLKVARTVSTVI
jgi:hypothetical protein